MTAAFGYSDPVPVSDAALSALRAFAVETVREAGAHALAHFRTDLRADNKDTDGGYDPVTAADRAVEAAIRAAIAERWPAHGVLGEEQGFTPGNGLTWVIDPIDGTRAFMTGMLHWGVLLALFDGRAPLLGLLYQPFTGELFVGVPEETEYVRGVERRRLTVRDCDGLEAAVLASTGPEFLRDDEATVTRLRERVRMVRWGGDCYLYAMLAAGQLDLAVEAGLNPYDVQALMPIIRGAGGVITCWDGRDAAMGGRILAAGDARVHAEAMAILGPAR